MTSGTLASTRLLLIGCGKMGGAMLAGWLARGLDPASVWVVDPGQSDLPNGVSRVEATDALTLDPAPDICVLAVKPQMMAEALPPYATLAAKGTVFLSVAAGKTSEGVDNLLGGGAAVVRAMPNTPAAVGAGMTVLFANDKVSTDARATCETLMGAVGLVDWIEDEGLMDAVTAVSGSGPAYVFLLAECLAAAGEAQGLPRALAARLARQTVSGAGALMAGAPEDPATLRKNVTSPNGTTAAALAVLMDDTAFPKALRDAVTAAADRSRDLAS
ncbi:MAG: pyrroline-5-carboxylate reductase [Rhodospirillum sp.]|nr:pyrroline-5-carboxylate reductase [Rhodospirillum sp.]MCF8491834.1 pyrroline-5-carboxylate reductase [Rhodospirillum sp.]MCF8503207.1 pyrroline-5-carboxylate reductase [Rhodospirillum sp.]